MKEQEITLWFNPGCARLQVAKAIKQTLNISVGEARDAVELGRVNCTRQQRHLVIVAIEHHGGKVE